MAVRKPELGPSLHIAIWYIVHYERDHILMGEGFSCPPDRHNFDISAALPRVHFHFGPEDSSCWRFPSF